MSYGSLARSASTYREMEVASATPGQLVVVLYDHLLVHLAKARHALAADSAEARSDALQVCRAVVGELLVTLDHERGAPLSTHLGAIYSFVLGELTTLGVRPDERRLQRLTGIISELRDAFASAVSATGGRPPTPKV